MIQILTELVRKMISSLDIMYNVRLINGKNFLETVVAGGKLCAPIIKLALSFIVLGPVRAQTATLSESTPPQK